MDEDDAFEMVTKILAEKDAKHEQELLELGQKHDSTLKMALRTKEIELSKLPVQEWDYASELEIYTRDVVARNRPLQIKGRG